MNKTEAATKSVQATKKGLKELERVIKTLTADDLLRTLENHWSVSATLAHLAFWDGFVEARWNRFSVAEGLEYLPDLIKDLANDAAAQAWNVLPPEDAVQLCVGAARSVTRCIQSLASETRNAAIESGRLAMLDRTLHWFPHLEEIRQVTSTQSPAPESGAHL